MGHLNGKDIYRKLGSKLDKLPTRAPWNERLRAILKELYTAEEADLVVRMPFGLSGFDRIQKITKVEPLRLIKLLETASSKGLVVDLFIQGRYYYMPSPLVTSNYMAQPDHHACSGCGTCESACPMNSCAILSEAS